MPAPPARGAALTSTLRATAAPYVPPATRTGATTQRKDESVTLSTHLGPPPMTTHPGTPSPSPLDSATTAACDPDLAGPEALGEGLPVPGWERGGGSDRAAAGESGRSAPALADQGDEDDEASQVFPSLFQPKTPTCVCVRDKGNRCPNGSSARMGNNCIAAAAPKEQGPRVRRQRRRLELHAAMPPVAEPPSPAASPLSAKASLALLPASLRSAPPALRNCRSPPRREGHSVRWANMGGKPLVSSSRTFTLSPDKSALFHTAAQIQQWRKEDRVRWKKERRKGRAPRTYQQWVFGQEALAPGEARARPSARKRPPAASCASAPTAGASPPPVTPPIAAQRRGPVPTTKPPSSKPGLVESELLELAPAPPPKGQPLPALCGPQLCPFPPRKP